MSAETASKVQMSAVATDPPVLELQDIHAYYGQIHALKGISLEVRSGEIVCLIGTNGAGKSTTLKTISGVLHPRSGEILFRGARIERSAPHQIVEMGISQAPEGRRVFGRMTVDENLTLGAFSRHDRAAIEEDRERVLTLFPRLAERRRQRSGTLSGGEQQMLAIARALMSRPSILLLDEPSMGLAPMLVETIFRTIQDIHAQGTTVLLVEQNAHLALRIAHRGYVLETGQVALSDSASQLRQNPEVQKVYLGVE
jgi:branched-chain amino acid transport system ATP-binding protein